MARVVLAVVLGALVHFGWGALSHMFLGWHEPTMGKFKNEEAVATVLSSNASTTEDLAYYIPQPPGGTPTPEEQSAWEGKHTAGPVGLVFWTPGGVVPMGTQTFLIGIVLDLVATIMAVFVLVVTLPIQQNYFRRVFIIVAMGIFAAVTSDLMFWNWMHYPMYYSFVNAADTIVGWTAAGLVIAAFVKPTTPAVL